MTYTKESIITKLRKLYSLPRNLRASNKSPMPFLKKCSCTGNLLPAHKTFIERPVEPGLCLRKYYIRALEIVLTSFRSKQETPAFLLNCKQYDRQWAKQVNDIKKTFYKNKYPKLNITTEDLLRKCDLQSQDAVIEKKWNSLFWQWGKKLTTLKYSD